MSDSLILALGPDVLPCSLNSERWMLPRFHAIVWLHNPMQDLLCLLDWHLVVSLCSIPSYQALLPVL